MWWGVGGGAHKGCRYAEDATNDEEGEDNNDASMSTYDATNDDHDDDKHMAHARHTIHPCITYPLPWPVAVSPHPQ